MSAQQAWQHIADLAAEHIRWQGRTLTPQKGCRLMQACLGDATVTVEYEYIQGEERTRDHPGFEPEVLILNVLINGAFFDPQGYVSESVLSRWEQEALEAETSRLEYEADAAAEAKYEAMREAA